MRWLLRRAAKVDVSRASENHERGPASRVTALVLRGVVKAMGKGTEEAGGSVGGEAALKARGILKALSLSRTWTMGRSPRRTTGGTAVSCTFVPIYIKGALHKRRRALMCVSRMLRAMLRIGDVTDRGVLRNDAAAI